jgi:competence protein ComGC
MMVVVLIMGILVAIAAPVFRSAQSNARERSCASNQRRIEDACTVWVSEEPWRSFSTLEGVVDANHPLVADGMLRKPPTCPSAPGAADRDFPDVSEGAYSIDADGQVEPCTFGEPAVHGHY